MTKIPENIMAIAREAIDSAAFEQFPDGTFPDATYDRVARAILAERDRCADVAIQYFRGDEYNSNQRSAGAMIYVAILAGEAA